MIINIDRRPEYSLFYIGSLIIELLKKINRATIETIYDKICLETNIDYNINYIYYSLDWLFLMEKINLSGDELILC